jgi:hypothetical protein
MLIAGNSREDGHLRLLMYMGKVTKYREGHRHEGLSWLGQYTGYVRKWTMRPRWQTIC